MPDQLHRFTFEHFGVRGELVSLAARWQPVVEHHNYSASVRDYLGQALVAATRLSGTIEFRRSLNPAIASRRQARGRNDKLRRGGKVIARSAALPIRRSHHDRDTTEP